MDKEIESLLKNKTVLIALKIATLAGSAETFGVDFGFGSDSDDMCKSYLTWANEIKEVYGTEDYYEVISQMFEEKMNLKIRFNK